MYIPKPIDTSDISLPEELFTLTEKIAENVHEVFAKSRIEEGWVYGEHRDDIRKTNPTLIPYSDLPESEKEYDRNTALETIKLIKKLGYEITSEPKGNLSEMGKRIIEFATAGKVWTNSWIREASQADSDELIIAGVAFRKPALQKLSNELLELQQATSDDDIDSIIYEDIIPMGLLYKEALWQQFQNLIDLWFGRDSD